MLSYTFFPRLLALFVAFMLLFAVTACGSNTSYSQPTEVEDCDFDDMLEGDEDCYGKSRSKTTKHNKVTVSRDKQKTTIKVKPIKRKRY